MNDDIALRFESVFLPHPVNPYTLAEERVWQHIVGSESIAPEHIAEFERQTGKAFDRNYLY